MKRNKNHKKLIPASLAAIILAATLTIAFATSASAVDAPNYIADMQVQAYNYKVYNGPDGLMYIYFNGNQGESIQVEDGVEVSKTLYGNQFILVYGWYHDVWYGYSANVPVAEEALHYHWGKKHVSFTHIFSYGPYAGKQLLIEWPLALEPEPGDGTWKLEDECIEKKVFFWGELFSHAYAYLDGDWLPTAGTSDPDDWWIRYMETKDICAAP